MTLLPELAERMLAAARSAAENAYAPYSNFPVGAAVLTDDETVFTGCNVENASYGLTVCAERVAIWIAASAGYRRIKAVAIVAPNEPGVTPCGACRQVLNEFAGADHDVIVVLESEHGPEQVSLSELLPRAFGPADLR